MKILLVLVLWTAAAQLGLAQLSMSDMKTIVGKEVSNKRAKCMVVGVIDENGKRFVCEGSLSDSNAEPPDENTVFEIASITKVFTSLVLAEMSLKKQVNLSDPLSKHLPPSAELQAKNGKDITLLDVASHRSGLPRMPHNYDSKHLQNVFSDYTKEDMYYYLANLQLDRDAGTKFQYSNIGYCTLGHILSRVAGTEYEQLVQEKVCRPLQMNRTGVAVTPEMKSNMAVGHTEYGKAIDPWVFPEHLAGTGALRSSANDLLTFAGANLGLVPCDLLPAMQVTHIPRGKKDGNDGFITMGWTYHNDDGEDYLWKDGAAGGYRSFIGIDMKRKIGIIILANSPNSTTDLGLHLIDSNHPIEPYSFKWQLLTTLKSELVGKGVDEVIRRYDDLKANRDSQYFFDPMQLNYLGNDLTEEKRFEDALKIYQLNAREYPKAPPVIESLAEGYRRCGNTTAAIEKFEMLAQFDSSNPRWPWIIQKIKKAK